MRSRVLYLAAVPSRKEGEKVTIVDSGPISSRIPTGTAITVFQTAALLIQVPASERGRAFSSASLILDCSLCSNNSSTIKLSLCSALEDKVCLETGIFNLPQSKKINATWMSKTFPVLKNDDYWLKVEGNAPTFQESFSWLDAKNFTATEAFTNENGSWTVLKDVVGASTLVFVVE